MSKKFLFRRIRGRIVKIDASKLVDKIDKLRNPSSPEAINKLVKMRKRANLEAKKVRGIAKGKIIPDQLKMKTVRSGSSVLEDRFDDIIKETKRFRSGGTVSKSLIREKQNVQVRSLLKLRKFIKKLEKL